MTDKFDVTVIGGGPAGYVCILISSIRFKYRMHRSRGSLGGTCLNIVYHQKVY